MATKTVTILDQSNQPQNGKWVWNENSNALEYQSNNPNADRQDKKGKNKGQQKGGHHMFDHGSKKGVLNDRGTTPSMGSRAFGRGRQSQIPGHKSPVRGQGKQQGEHNYVTVEDVKNVAINMLGEVFSISPVFEGIYGTAQFDEFLLFLLNFFHWYFEKRAQEQKPNPMNIEPSLREKQYYEDLCTKIEGAQKQLGRAYCVLVLGIGLDTQHHMACGSNRVSNTYKDRDMYETLYRFCTFVVWIAFKRKEYEVVRKEVGRMLRSDTFNPAIRVKNAPSPAVLPKPGEKALLLAQSKEPPEQEEKENKEAKEKKENEKKLTPAEYRRLHGKRPPIKSIINQRSPALVSILPSPKEEANWLFRRQGALSPTALGSIGKEELDENTLQGQYEHLRIDVSKLKTGIIGEPYNQFNPLTLTQIGTETEEEENEEEKKDAPGSPGKTPASQPGAASTERRMSREPTGVSTVTEDAPEDE